MEWPKYCICINNNNGQCKMKFTNLLGSQFKPTLSFLSCPSSMSTSPKSTKLPHPQKLQKLFTADTVATSKLGSLSSMGVIFACVVFCEATCSINSYPQSTRKPKRILKQGTFLFHLLLIMVLPLLFTNTKWKTKSINEKGYISSRSELLLLLIPKKIRFLLLLFIFQTRFFFFLMLIILLQTKKNQEDRIKGKRKQKTKKIVFFL